MSVIGITGSFGSGKTTVAGFFKKLGVKIVDVDRISRKLLKINTPAYKKLLSVFKDKILKKGSFNIDRRELAQLVFKNRRHLRQLNQIMHPQIIREIKMKIKFFKEDRANKIVIIDAPLLIETGLLNLVDKLVVVTTTKKNQLSRLKKRMGLTEKEIKLRINAQLPLRKKIRAANYLIDNNGSLANTKKQVKEIWKGLN